MNNTCPTCGAVYNVAAKDVGRKIKCKKCSAALVVTDNGLEEDDGRAPASDPKPRPAVVEDDGDGDEDDRPVVKKGKKYGRSGGDPLAALSVVGGLPTILFAFGVFLVIVFTSLPIIGEAGSDRAALAAKKLELERDVKIKDKEPKKKQAEWTAEEAKAYGEAAEKIRDDYKKQIEDARLDAARTQIANRRDVWLERYGLMFGFLSLSFGCIGYLRTEQPLVLKIVAAVVLSLMLLLMFNQFSGCDRRSPVPIGKVSGPID